MSYYSTSYGSSTLRSPSVGTSKRRDKGESGATASRASPRTSTKSSTGTVTPTSDYGTTGGSSANQRSPSVKARPQTASHVSKGYSATTGTDYSTRTNGFTRSMTGSPTMTGSKKPINPRDLTGSLTRSSTKNSSFTGSPTGASTTLASSLTSTSFKTGQEVVTKEGKRATVIGPVKGSPYEFAVVTSNGEIEWHWYHELRN